VSPARIPAARNIHAIQTVSLPWICTRNDVLGNLAVLLAALGGFGTGTGWPDVIVAAIMAALALQGATTVVQQSLKELRQPVTVPAE
jgi:Co/Zn/Cd efflux system component